MGSALSFDRENDPDVLCMIGSSAALHLSHIPFLNVTGSVRVARVNGEFIAMPMKYFAGMPLMVQVFGWIHGLLFVFFLVALLRAWSARRWSILRAFIVFLASLIPFGTFILDPTLRKEEVVADGR